MKTVSIAVILFAAAFIGNFFSMRLRQRVTALRRINYMIEEITMLLRYRSPTVYEILDALRQDGRFDDFDFLRHIPEGIPFQRGWQEAVSEYPVPGLTKSDTALLADIGSRLGTCDTESQLGTLALQRAELKIAMTSAETDYSKKGKLYRSLGVLAGAFISIILI